MKRNYLLFIISLVIWTNVQCQYYNTGADPFSTDWCQIKTENYQIIFSREYESQAQIFASKMDYAYDYVAKSMSSKPRKLSVIIHTQSATSNGLVAWAPRRMELWTTPSQDAFNYSQEWMEQLIIHESRHFVQENKMNQGFTKVLKVILGEQAEMIPLGMMTRQWFMEGDAVATETALSHSGRGRMPTFEQGLRALTLEKGKQTYDVAHLGTYRHYMPNHYEVGYHTIAANRLYRDKDMFDDKMDDIGRFSTLRGMRDSRKMKYYGYAIDVLEEKWKEQDAQLEKTPYDNIIDTEEGYSSYSFLQEEDGKLYALRNSLDNIPEIVEIDSAGVYRMVSHIGWMSEPDFSVRNGKLVYADEVQDARWEQRSYADLFVVDLKTNKRKRITYKQVLQSPSFNDDASLIVAQLVDGNGAYVLQIIDANTGGLVRQIPNPKNQFYFSPNFSADGTKIVYVAQEKDTKCLKCFDLESNKEVLLVEGTYGEMAHPLLVDGKIYFSGSYSGINNIYSCDMTSKAVKRESSARFGADYPTLVGEQLYFCNYTSDGYRPVKHLPSDVAGEPLGEVENMSLGLGDKLTEQEGEVIDFSKAPINKYKVKNYSRLGHLFHVHSWLPSFSSADVASETSENLYPSIKLLSQNKLSTSFLTATYDGNPANSSERFNIDYAYNGFYPQLGLDLTLGNFDRIYNVYVPRSSGYESVPEIHKTSDFIISPSVTLPLSFNQGVYSYLFSTKLYTNYIRLKAEGIDYEDNYFTRGFSTYFVRAKQRAIRDLYSPFRQEVSFSLDYNDQLSERYKMASSAQLYFPGISAHHSLQLAFNWQKKDINSSNALLSLPRGYSSSVNSKVMYASVDYLLPLAYPDMHLGSLLNIKRWSMGVYGDIAQVADEVGDQNLQGAGASVFFDMNFLRYEVDVRLGLQAGVMSYSSNVELAYPVNLILNFSVF